MEWSAETIARVDEDSLAGDDGSRDNGVARVTVNDLDLLEAIQDRWYHPTRAGKGQSKDFDIRFLALLRFDDGTTHRFALDAFCFFLFVDGNAHELDVTLGRRLLAQLPEDHQRIFKEWSPTECRPLLPRQ